MRRLLLALALFSLPAVASAQAIAPYSANIRLPVFTGGSGGCVDGTGASRCNLTFTPDNTYDIGASGATRPKNIYASGFVTAPSGFGAGTAGGTTQGMSFSGTTTAINSGAAGIVRFLTNAGNAPIMDYTATAPTIGSGFGTSPAILSGTSAGFRVNVGTGGTATTGVVTLPTATNGWNCTAQDLTAQAAHTADRQTRVVATSTTSVSLENQIVSTGATVGAPWTASATLLVLCTPY